MGHFETLSRVNIGCDGGCVDARSRHTSALAARRSAAQVDDPIGLGAKPQVGRWCCEVVTCVAFQWSVVSCQLRIDSFRASASSWLASPFQRATPHSGLSTERSSKRMPNATLSSKSVALCRAGRCEAGCGLGAAQNKRDGSRGRRLCRRRSRRVPGGFVGGASAGSRDPNLGRGSPGAGAVATACGRQASPWSPS